MRWCFGVVSAVLLSSAAFGWQSPPKPLPPGVAESDVFHLFFVSVTQQEAIADQARADGKNEAHIRAMMRSQAHLTLKEDDLVKQVARHCNDDYNSDTQTAMAQAAQLRKDHPLTANGIPDPEIVAGVASFRQRREDLMQGCMLDLKRGMPDSRFKMLRDYVLRNFGQGIHHIDAPLPQATKIPN